MPRKALTLEGERARVESVYGRKSNIVRGKRDGEKLTDDDRVWLKTKAIFLKANDATHAYISDATMVTKSTIDTWLYSDECQQQVKELRADMLKSAQKYLRTYALELIELLVDLAKSTAVEPRVRLNAITEALDRMGMSKVARSENVQHTEVELSDTAGIVEALRDNPQLAIAAAKKVEELQALVGEVKS